MLRTFRTITLALTALVLLPLFTPLAHAQKGPPPPPPRSCGITGPFEAVCSATLCGPPGAVRYIWAKSKTFPGALTQCITVTESGTYTLNWLETVDGKFLTCSQTVFIEKCTQNRPPDCSGAHAKNPVLWPPDHKLEPVEIEGVTDPDGDRSRSPRTPSRRTRRWTRTATARPAPTVISRTARRLCAVSGRAIPRARATGVFT
jgi:hypothetical protein